MFASRNVMFDFYIGNQPLMNDNVHAEHVYLVGTRVILDIELQK